MKPRPTRRKTPRGALRSAISHTPTPATVASASRETLSVRQPGSSTVARRCGPAGARREHGGHDEHEDGQATETEGEREAARVAQALPLLRRRDLTAVRVRRRDPHAG